LTIRVILVDDHAVVLEGIQRLLEVNDISVAGTANNAKLAWEVYQEQKPDLLIMDISMPGTTGVDAVTYIKNRDEDAKIVVFSIHENPQFVERVIAAGALAYVTKGSELHELINAVKAVYNGKSYIASDLIQEMVFSRINLEESLVKQLSHREFDIVCLIAEGNSTSDIAQKMFLAEKTVSNYIGKIKQKLHLKNTTDIVRLAIQYGLVQLDGIVSIHD